jgi:hypothetical protein
MSGPGPSAGSLAIAVRALYLASDETKMEWHLTNRRLLGPGPRAIALENITDVRSLFSAVQVVTVTGDKHLLKYQADAPAVIAAIDTARGPSAHDQRASPQRPSDRPGGGTETLGWLRIEGGEIAETGEGPRQGGLDCGGLCLAPGLVDVGVKVGEPGERHKESLRTAGLAAAAGGVTSMIIAARHADPHRHARSAGFRPPPRP